MGPSALSSRPPGNRGSFDFRNCLCWPPPTQHLRNRNRERYRLYNEIVINHGRRVAIDCPWPRVSCALPERFRARKVNMSTDEDIKTEEVTYRFLTGTWYSVTIPKEREGQPGYSPEEIYSGYFDDSADPLPDDVEVSEDEVDHVWEDDLNA